jgi:hypothetical protein
MYDGRIRVATPLVSGQRRVQAMIRELPHRATLRRMHAAYRRRRRGWRS